MKNAHRNEGNIRKVKAGRKGDSSIAFVHTGPSMVPQIWGESTKDTKEGCFNTVGTVGKKRHAGGKETPQKD